MSADPPERNEDPADELARRRFIARSIWFTIPGAYALIGAAYVIVSSPPGLGEASQRLLLAVRWLLVAFTPYAAVCLAILYLRYAEGAHNPLISRESERLKIHCRVMQNTLEQLVWFALCIVPLATYLSPARARVIPILCVFFAVARFVYWWGYFRNGTLGRALGVQLTFSLNIPLLVVALVFFARGLAS